MRFQPSSFSPADSHGSALVAAVQWLQGTLLGTVATTVAVVAIASVGLMMLTGRVSFRRAGEVILGCFIIFGASSIAAGIHSAAESSEGNGDVAAVMPAVVLPRPSVPLPAAPVPVDPYAGAAVPTRR